MYENSLMHSHLSLHASHVHWQVPIINNLTVKLSLDSSCHTAYQNMRKTQYRYSDLKFMGVHYVRSLPDIALHIDSDF